METTQIWHACLYLRLSKDDRDKDESNSIKNQRDLLLDFVNRNADVRVVEELADDGFTGANFDRAAFKEMIRHIEEGAVNCVIVKDFSRLGRNHIETGKYIERYFMEKKVRFIAVNEGYDSLKADVTDGSNSLIIPFKNIINEAFLEDISVKTKSQLDIKRKNGELLCNYSVYGYAKQDGKLIVDDYAADIVRNIFAYKIDGYNEQQIAVKLNAEGVLSPAEYKKSLGIPYNTPFAVNGRSLWSVNAIKRILKNRAYIGHLEQGKRTKASYRMKQFQFKPETEWVVQENNHEPVIALSDFNLVQELMAKDTRVLRGAGQLHMFSGLMVCGCCCHPMIVRTVKKNGKSYVYYICSTHTKYGSCHNNSISAGAIEKYALASIQNQISGLLSANEISGGLGADTLQSRKQSAIQGMIENSLCVIGDNSNFLVKAYEHYVDGAVTEDEYRMFKDSFQKQIKAAEGNIESLRAELERLKDNSQARELVERFLEHENITELNRAVVVNLIESITVFGNRELEIRFRYMNGFDVSIQPVPEKGVV